MKSPNFKYNIEFFSKSEVNELAKETNFMKRFRSINGFYFLMSLVFYGGNLAISLRGLKESFFRFKKSSLSIIIFISNSLASSNESQ